MKKFSIYNIVNILAFIAFAFTPLNAFATDLWAETPNLFDNTELSSEGFKSAGFIHSKPQVNMWSETPDLYAETEDYNFMLDGEGRFVNTFVPEMFVETPALDEIVFRPQLLDDMDSLLAEGR